MDTGKGTFEELDIDPMSSELEKHTAMQKVQARHANRGGWFQVGEELEIKGSRFRVQNITPKGMRLKLLKRK